MADRNILADEVAAALDDLDEDEAAGLTATAQLGLLPTLTADEGYRPKGRRPGSVNKRARDLARYILARHRHPIDAVASIVDMPITALAADLACTKLEAFEAWRKCAELVARYVAQPQPQAVSVTAQLDGHLTVINMSAPLPGQDRVIDGTLEPEPRFATYDEAQAIDAAGVASDHVSDRPPPAPPDTRK